MGVGYKTTKHSTFTSKIIKGDFIAADFEKDGKWDHLGFVTDRKSKKANGYYNYRVAQHSGEYNTWVSSKDNAWEEIGKNGGRYARVRR